MGWHVTIEGTSPPLHVYERAGRGNQLYLRWSKPGGHCRPKLKGLETVRRTDGKLDPALVTRARALALRQYEAAKAGAPKPEGTPRKEGPVTLVRGFDRVLEVPGGKYATKDDPQWKKMRRARDHVLGILEASRLWGELWSAEFGTVWRTLAQRYKDGASDLDWRAVEEVVQMFVAASNWLGGEGGVLRSARQPPKKWRAALKRDWEQVTGEAPESDTPRHSPEELDRLWAALPGADPRLRLWVELGGLELRGGQVLRGRRKDLDLTPGSGTGHGVFRIRGRGKKKGETVYLTPEQRKAVDHAFGPDGFLGDLEAQYRDGEIADYPLWPGGPLHDGKAVHQGTTTSRRTMYGFFRDLEDVAGVPHRKGRGWYGGRRGSADRVRRVTTDEKVKNAAGGWAPGSTVRASLYEDGADPEVLREAAEARRRARRAGTTDPDGGTVSPVEAAAALEALGVAPEKLEAMLTVLGLEKAS